ncbi:MAG: XdhC family protein [Desulfuromonadaceae bacterium]|nr:XdhC family protein [Desulfuromonadaceae bacterium]MDD5105002.1 XdhC family protein [Desulfuromonadaceae bacterium]
MLMSWLAQTICGLQNDEEDQVLVTVLSKSGSAPCLAGSKMVVLRNGASYGTVGGGVLESAAQKRAARVFKSGIAETMSFDLNGAEAASMQMICGGNVKLLVDYVPASPENSKLFSSLRDALQSGEKCYLIASLGRVGGVKAPTLRSLVLGNRSLTGEFPYPPEWLDRLIEKASRSTYPVEETIEGEQFVIERCYIPSTLYIYGAGHVSQQLASLATTVDFQTVVLDDRSEFANRERFPHADEIHVLESFDDCFTGLVLDGDSYVVIVTRGHLHDKTVLAQALRSGAGYIGMMGSRRKREELFALLQQEGHPAEALERVHCPIGLAIKAATTAEIAVSIVAELIQTRAQAVK